MSNMAKKLKMGKGLLDLVYPIDSTYITKSNVNPKTLFGGEWELIDKEFKSKRITDKTIVTGINATISTFTAVFGGHSVRFRCDFTINVDLADSTVQLFTIDLAKIGTTNFHMQLFNGLMGSDGGNSVIMYTFHYSSGLVSSVEVINKTGTGTCPSGVSANMNVVLPMDYTYMLDSLCDKFYWRRIA